MLGITPSAERVESKKGTGPAKERRDPAEGKPHGQATQSSEPLRFSPHCTVERWKFQVRENQNR